MKTNDMKEIKNENKKNYYFLSKDKLLSLASKPIKQWTLADFGMWCECYGTCAKKVVDDKNKYPCIFSDGNNKCSLCIEFRELIYSTYLRFDSRRIEFLKELMKSIIKDEE